jgi:hypothetical protein
VVKNPKLARRKIPVNLALRAKTAEIRRFSKLARLVQSCVHPAEGPLERNTRGFEMTATSTFSQRLFAVVAALSMSTFMVVASFSPPSAAAVQAMYA